MKSSERADLKTELTFLIITFNIAKEQTSKFFFVDMVYRQKWETQRKKDIHLPIHSNFERQIS